MTATITASHFHRAGTACAANCSCLREYDCNHFEPYYPPMFDTFANEQADFLLEKLQP